MMNDDVRRKKMQQLSVGISTSRALGALLVTSSLLAACATRPVPVGGAAPASSIYAPKLTQQRAGTATVTVTRDTGVVGSVCEDVVYIDGQKVAALNVGQEVTVYLAPGHHVFGTTTTGICSGGSSSIEDTLQAGDVRGYRIGRRKNGTVVMQPSAF